MNLKSLAFVRTEEGTNTTVAILVLGVASAGMSDEEALTRLRAAITDWVTQSDEGAAAWKTSCQDFNIGDLAHYDDSQVLGRHLADHGIFELSLTVADPLTKAIGYDEKLVNEDALP